MQRKIILILFFLVNAFVVQAQDLTAATNIHAPLKTKSDINVVDQSTINQLGASINSHSFLYGDEKTDYDALENKNQQLTTALQYYAKQHANFLQQDAPFSEDSYLTVLTSADKQFRIICWNDGMSGTMQQWRAIAFWKTTAGIQTKILQADDNHRAIYGLTPEFWNIATYQLNDGQTAYLVIGMGHGSNRIKFSFVKAYTIEPTGHLNDDFKLFKTPSRVLNHISLRIDLMSAPRFDDIYTIHLNKEGKSLYIPVADEDGKLTIDKYLVYQFDGRYFVFQGVK